MEPEAAQEILRHGDTHAFILRIWPETLDVKGQPQAWKGTLDHVGSDKRLYFCDLQGIGRFIQEATGIRIQNSIPWWQVCIDLVFRKPTGRRIGTLRGSKDLDHKNVR